MTLTALSEMGPGREVARLNMEAFAEVVLGEKK